ncbi:MAG TPA: VOC family protein [Candidatus Dormibacteraeota bacterium]|nr:VOC family protein [Candidatus Dormibacteraeota bacterium]
MKQQVAPYINFQGRAREAMELYQSVLGGKLELYAAGEQGAPRPAQPGDRIQHARLSGDGFLVIGSDGHPSYPPTSGDSIALALVGTDRAKMQAAFAKLSDGGVVKMPLTEGSWGGAAAWLTDRFGINWNLDLQPE